MREPCTHAKGRRFPEPVVREMLRALGVVTCQTCHEVIRILGPRGKAWVRE